MAKDKSPNELESALRKSAERLAADWRAARDAGFVVAWPASADGLAALDISATGVIAEDGDQATELTPVAPATGGAAVPAATGTSVAKA